MARTTAQTNPATGQPIYVGEGAVRQQGAKKLYTCNACGRDVVWLESKRTGKVYLASVYSGEVSRYYVSRPHECKPRYEPPVPVLSPYEAAYQALTAKFCARELSRDEYLAAADVLDRTYGEGAYKAAQTDESGLADEIRDWATS